MKILILGSSGFVGKNMMEYFRKQEYEVYGPGHEELNVLNEHDVYEYLKEKKFDVVVNALDSDGSKKNYMEIRLRMYYNLAKYSSLYGKMIYFGSGAEFGRETSLIRVNESDFDRCIPTDTYGFCLYQMCKDAIRSENIYNLRLFGIFGKYEIWQQRFISNAICKCLMGYPITIRQDRIMDYLHIDDLCKITEWMCIHNPKYHHYNAVSGKSYRLSELAERINKQLNMQLPIYMAMQGDYLEYTADNKQLLNEIRNFDMEDINVSINKLIDYYKKNINQIDRLSLLYQK